MSRLGRQPIAVPDKVKVAVSGQTVSAEGPAGKGAVTLHPEVRAKVEGRSVLVTCEGKTKPQKQLWGAWRSHVANLLTGVATGYERVLEINGVGYNVKQQGDKLSLAVGLSHPVEYTVPEGLTVTCPNATTISVKGTDKHQVGQFAAVVRAARPAEPYNMKGVKYRDEVVRRKAGKTFVTGG